MRSNVCDLYQKSNLLINDFRVCDCITLDSLFNTYCMHMYGYELWDLSCKYIDEFKVAWKKIKRRVWRLPAQAHNTIVRDLTRVGKMPAFMSKVHAGGIYRHLPAFTGIYRRLLEFTGVY